jgi:serine/threonine protein kinase/Tol biopolymer transport system component
MALPLGVRLGAYEILAPLGAGGMGEVYRARDTRLDRQVALKVLPPRLAGDPQALARFEREAKAVAALSHPNILSIFDFGTQDDLHYAVTELLDGTTLREGLGGRALPVRRALDLAVQIAHGLFAAHEKGIVHRDMKPENVFVTSGGPVKILDFGLARLEPPAVAEGTQTPTVSRHTEPGTVMGTVGYMSPEQVRGLPVDRRSDMFSFGCVLHEMLSGRRAFQRATGAETMTAILNDEPGSLEAPAALQRIVSRCLEKEPARRFQSASDLAFALQALSGSETVSVPTAPPAGRRWRALAALGVLVPAALGWVLGRRSGAPLPEEPLTSPGFTRLTNTPGVEEQPSLSSDGSSILFVGRAAGNADVYLQRVGGRNAINLTKDSPADDYAPAFSPDGARIAFRSERDGGGIFLMGATGESTKRLTDFGHDPAWSPRGDAIVVSTEHIGRTFGRASFDNELWMVTLPAGEKRLLVKGGDATQPAWSPHGDRIAFAAHVRGFTFGLFTIAAAGDSQVEVPLTQGWRAAAPVWSADGRFVYYTSEEGGTANAWRIAVDEKTGRARGDPEAVPLPASAVGGISMSGDGRQLAFGSLDDRSTIYGVDFDPVAGRIAGAPKAILRSRDRIPHSAVSPDGEWLAFWLAALHDSLWVVRFDGSDYRQLTDDKELTRGPAWSPDGKRIAFFSRRSGPLEIWAIRPDGSGLEQLSQPADGSLISPTWSPAGKRLVASRFREPGLSEESSSPVIFDAAGTSAARAAQRLPPMPDGRRFIVSCWSPDGALLIGHAFQADGSQAGGVWVHSLETGTYEKLTEAGFAHAVLRDGRRLLVSRGTPEGTRLELFDRHTRRSTDVGAIPGAQSFSLSHDERRLAFVEYSTEGDIWLMTMGGNTARTFAR